MNIVLTGGGTAGHAMVNLVLAGIMREDAGSRLVYIGSKKGAERAMLEAVPGVSYFPISTGKLRRYLSLENVLDFFRVCLGISEAYGILKREGANVVFSGGGFVSLPVVVAAWLQKIPVLIRETDISMGLANRICAKFAQKIFTTFPDTLDALGGLPHEYGGLIIRPELIPEQDLPDSAKLPDSADCRPSVLVMGGSLGSQAINTAVWDNIDRLASSFKIRHLCGRGQSRPAVRAPGYLQSDYVSDMAELYQTAQVLVTRCGSNAICEGLALGKRMVCIPLSTRFSRGEQLQNARYAEKNGCAVILQEEELLGTTLERAISEVLKKPLKQDCVLSRVELYENCRRIVSEIYTAAEHNRKNRRKL